jgi:hypothetical protein
MSCVDDCWRALDVAVAEWRLGDLPAESLPAAAVSALSAGCDSPSLAHLAAMDGSGWSEIEPVVGRVLRERGLSVPTPDEAVKRAADEVLRKLVAGDAEPQAGADRLHALAWKAVDRPPWEDLVTFVTLSGDFDAVEAAHWDRADVCEVVLRKARELLDRGGVRVS